MIDASFWLLPWWGPGRLAKLHLHSVSATRSTIQRCTWTWSLLQIVPSWRTQNSTFPIMKIGS
jgi:hypothetical protein